MFTAHPKWKANQELIVAAIDGFCAGIKTVMKPSLASGVDAKSKMDREAYEFIMARKVLKSRRKR